MFCNHFIQQRWKLLDILLELGFNMEISMIIDDKFFHWLLGCQIIDSLYLIGVDLNPLNLKGHLEKGYGIWLPCKDMVFLILCSINLLLLLNLKPKTKEPDECIASGLNNPHTILHPSNSSSFLLFDLKNAIYVLFSYPLLYEHVQWSILSPMQQY